MKEYQSELTKANRRAAENRIREDVIVKCKHCKRLMEFINDGSVNSKNYKKALARIDELKESYIPNGS